MFSTYTLFEQDDREYPFKTVPELLRWAKKEGLFPKEKVSKPQLNDGEYAVRKKNRNKERMLNRRTGRMKKQTVPSWEITIIRPEDRTLDNLPTYADKTPKVRFQDWLQLKKNPELYNGLSDRSWGWSPNGRCYGWSHRAISSFGIDDDVTPNTAGNDYEKNWKIRSHQQAEEMAKKFSDDVS